MPTHQAVREVRGEVAVGADAEQDKVEHRKPSVAKRDGLWMMQRRHHGPQYAALRETARAPLLRNPIEATQGSGDRACGSQTRRAGLDLVLVRHSLRDGGKVALNPVNLISAGELVSAHRRRWERAC